MPRPRAHIDPAAVTRAFAPDGLHGATTEEIARCAGVAKPTVYAHGGSKEAIFLACVEAEVERLLSELARADLETRSADLETRSADLETRLLPTRARLSALAGAILEHARAHPAGARLLHVTARHATSGVAEEVDAALARLPARLAQILRRDTTPACADRIAPALLGAAAALALRGSPPEALRGAPEVLRGSRTVALRGSAAEDLQREAVRHGDAVLHGDPALHDDATLLGEAFAAALEPVEGAAVADRVKSVGLY
jgi:AcrR family transcriptional regulator